MSPRKVPADTKVSVGAEEIFRESSTLREKNFSSPLARALYDLDAKELTNETVDSYTGKVDVVLRAEHDHADRGCPFSVPADWRAPNPLSAVRQKHHREPAERFPRLCDEAAAGRIEDQTLLAAAALQASRVPILRVRGWDDSETYFPGKVKGTAYYGSVQKTRIRTSCRQINDLDGSRLFITLTLDQSQFKGNILAAWKVMAVALSKFFKKLKHFAKCQYVCVLEAHNSGFPHAHVLIGFEEKIIPHFVGKNGAWRIKNYGLKKLLSSFWNAGYSDFKVVNTNHTDSYMIKYLAKGFDKKINSDLLVNGKLKSETRKNYLAVMLSILSGCRLIHISQKLNGYYVSRKSSRVESELDDHRVEVAAALDGAATKFDLIALMNKFLRRCRRTLVLWPSAQVTPDLLDLSGQTFHISDSPPQVDESGCYCLSCPGCKLSQVVADLVATYSM